MAIPAAAITENYAALQILKQEHLNAAIGDNVEGSIEYYLNNYVRLNFEQLRLDLFGGSYDYTNDGIASLASPLSDLSAFLAEDETITGNWTFTGTVGFSAAVTSTSTFTATNQHRAKAYRSTSDQSIANSTLTAVQLNAETYDTQALHDSTTNNSRLTIPTGGGGLYSFNAQVTFAASATGIRTVGIYKSGTKMAEAKSLSNTAGDQCVINLGLHDLAAQSDYYEVQVTQTSGGALNVVNGQNTTFFSAIKIW